MAQHSIVRDNTFDLVCQNHLHPACDATCCAAEPESHAWPGGRISEHGWQLKKKASGGAMSTKLHAQWH